MVRFRITFASCFMMLKVHGWETFLKCRVGLSHKLVCPRPLILGMPHSTVLPYT
jgi:hypothetical protein